MDGLLACPQPRALASAQVGVLVHLPLALEAGLSDDRAAELDRLERQALHAARVVVATSHWSADYLERHHLLTGVAVAPPGAEPSPVGVGSDPPLLVHLAALLPNKDQLGVVAALSGLTDLSWRARLVGPDDRDPAYAAAVRDAVRAAGLEDRVEIPGAMAREAAWAGADLALLPSRVETFGMVVTEALARGVPAVVSEGGAEEALGFTADGERPGVVVPAGDPERLALALRRWLTDSAHRGELRATRVDEKGHTGRVGDDRAAHPEGTGRRLRPVSACWPPGSRSLSSPWSFCGSGSVRRRFVPRSRWSLRPRCWRA